MGPVFARIVVVTCSCGQFPLEQAAQPTARKGWEAAAAHAALNPTKCQPAMFWDDVPAALAPTS